ncbi:MAG: RNA-directed DNA polymerase [Brumimicrobium sp.]
MKTVKNIYSRIATKENVLSVIQKSSKGKKYAHQIVKKQDKYVDFIVQTLVSKEYLLHPTKTEIIKEREKPRLITKSPYFPNKIYDYLLVDGIKEVVDKGMYKWCVGNVKGRGKDVGINYVFRYIKEYKYAIKLDIKKFYDNIDKEVLYNLVSNRISDTDFMNFFKAVIGDNGKGIGLGLNSSQWLSNFYLQELDYYIKQELKIEKYVRYVDDLVLISNNARKLKRAIVQIGAFLGDKLKLTLKYIPEVINVASGASIEFLGYKISRREITLKKRLFHRFVKLYKRMVVISKKRAKTVVALWGWFVKTTKSYAYYVKYLREIISFTKIKEILKGGFKYELARN